MELGKTFQALRLPFPITYFSKENCRCFVLTKSRFVVFLLPMIVAERLKAIGLTQSITDDLNNQQGLFVISQCFVRFG